MLYQKIIFGFLLGLNVFIQSSSSQHVSSLLKKTLYGEEPFMLIKEALSQKDLFEAAIKHEQRIVLRYTGTAMTVAEIEKYLREDISALLYDDKTIVNIAQKISESFKNFEIIAQKMYFALKNTPEFKASFDTTLSNDRGLKAAAFNNDSLFNSGFKKPGFSGQENKKNCLRMENYLRNYLREINGIEYISDKLKNELMRYLNYQLNEHEVKIYVDKVLHKIRQDKAFSVQSKSKFSEIEESVKKIIQISLKLDSNFSDMKKRLNYDVEQENLRLIVRVVTSKIIPNRSKQRQSDSNLEQEMVDRVLAKLREEIKEKLRKMGEKEAVALKK